MRQYLTALTNVTESSCSDVAGAVDLPLSLFGEVFKRYLSVRHIAQLLTHGKTVKIARSVLCKITVCKDIIFNKQFRAPTIYCQVLIFVDKFCWVFFHQLQIEDLKNICSKIWYKGTIIEIAVQLIFHVNVNFPWKRRIISMNYFECVFQ